MWCICVCILRRKGSGLALVETQDVNEAGGLAFLGHPHKTPKDSSLRRVT